MKQPHGGPAVIVVLAIKRDGMPHVYCGESLGRLLQV